MGSDWAGAEEITPQQINTRTRHLIIDCTYRNLAQMPSLALKQTMWATCSMASLRMVVSDELFKLAERRQAVRIWFCKKVPLKGPDEPHEPELFHA